MKRKVLIGLLACGFMAQASAAGLISERNISLALANDLASAAIQACGAEGYNVAVTVVDRSGTVKAVQRMDKAGPHTLEASRMKAFTALTTRAPTDMVMENAQKNAGAQHLADIPGFLLLGGGLPVKVGEETVGAIGIGGAPGGHLDKQCAVKALDAVKAQLS